MSETIIVALITGGLAFAGTVFSNIINNNKTIYRIEQLEHKQDKHNEVIERVYHLEQEEAVIMEKISVANHRIDDLEKSVQKGA